MNAPKVATTATDVAELRAAFPGWSIWVSDGGHWYATRRTRQHDRAPLFGLWPTVDGADLAALRTQLTVQAERAAAVLEVISAFAWSLVWEEHLCSSNRTETAPGSDRTGR